MRRRVALLGLLALGGCVGEAYPPVERGPVSYYRAPPVPAYMPPPVEAVPLPPPADAPLPDVPPSDMPPNDMPTEPLPAPTDAATPDTPRDPVEDVLLKPLPESGSASPAVVNAPAAAAPADPGGAVPLMGFRPMRGQKQPGA